MSHNIPGCYLVVRRYRMLSGCIFSCIGLYYVDQKQDMICLNHFAKSDEYSIHPYWLLV